MPEHPGMDQYTRPHRDRVALLTIDMQNDFTLPDAPATIPGTQTVVPKITDLIEAFRTTNRSIIHVVRLYQSDGSNVDLCRRQAIETGTTIVTPDTTGANLIPDLTPNDTDSLDASTLLDGDFQALAPAEWVMYKPRWSAFYNTRLDSFLDEHGVDTLVVCGCNFPNCPRTTIYDASARDYRVIIVPDATSQTYDRGLTELEDIGVHAKSTRATIEWLTNPTGTTTT